MIKPNLGKPLPKISADYVDPVPTPQEIDVLISLWNTYAPKQYHGLLEAQVKSVLDQTGEKPAGKFIYDDQRGRYIEVTTGRVLSMDEVRVVHAQFVKAYARR